MKTKLLNMLMLCIIIATTSSCKKDEAEKKDNGLSSKINAIISQDIIDDLQRRGMTINTGYTAPVLESIINVNPFTVLSPYGVDDNYYTGQVISDYKFRFYDQSGDELKVSYKGNAGDIANGTVSFLSGNGNNFTLFMQLTGVNNGISNKQVAVLSGTKAGTGIVNFQCAFVLTDKYGDEDNAMLMPVGKSRIFLDGDYLAENTLTYRGNAIDHLTSGETLFGIK